MLAFTKRGGGSSLCFWFALVGRGGVTNIAILFSSLKSERLENHPFKNEVALAALVAHHTVQKRVARCGSLAPPFNQRGLHVVVPSKLIKMRVPLDLPGGARWQDVATDCGSLNRDFTHISFIDFQ